MRIYSKDEIFAHFAQGGAVPTYPAGATQEQLAQLFVQDPRASYAQFCYDEICKAQDNPLCQETQDEYPRTPQTIRDIMGVWDRDRALGNGAYPIDFEQALGGYSERLRLASSRPNASQTPSAVVPDRPKSIWEKTAAELSPEELTARRASVLGRVRKYRERQKESRLARAEERHDVIAKEEQERRQAFGAEFAGNPNPDPDKPSEPKAEDVPQVVPRPWQ